MIAFLRSIHASVDSRLTRYVLALEELGKGALIVQWKRGGEGRFPGKRAIFESFGMETRLGGGWKNAVALLMWMVWSFLALLKNRKHISAVHAIDLDTALPALLFAKLFRKKLIFDIYDSYGDARNMAGAGRRMVDAVESYVARRADCVILPDSCRASQIPHDVKKVTFIENVPSNMQPGTEKIIIDDSRRVKFAYVGILEVQHRGLEDLLAVVAKYPDTVELHIAGFGPLSEMCAKAALDSENIRYYGPVTPEQAIQIMGGCDVVVGMYYRTKEHHFRATPNKFYEHLMLGKPLLTTTGTPPGEKVATGESGWAVEEGQSGIDAVINTISKAECKRLGGNASQKWNENYADYFQKVLVEHYAGEICST